MRHRLFALVTILTILTAFQLAAGDDGATGMTADQQQWEQAKILFKPLPAAAPNPDNPVTAAKVELGKKLYLDPRLSKDGNVSCNSCHSLAAFGVDRLPFSPGDAGELGGRNSPTVLNAALHVAQFWDGRAADVEEQAGMPILNPVEMAIPSEEFLVDRLSRYPEYEARFAASFPDAEKPLTYENIARALAAFERTLLTPSRFDRYLEGDLSALSSQEKAGLGIFVGYGCTSCHNGMTIGGHIFRKFGLNDDYWVHTHSRKIDEGRYPVTGEEEDKFVFKVASLRNVAETYPYFHDGSVTKLDDAIRVMLELQVGVGLADEEVENVVAFLGTLSGKVPAATMPAP